MQCKFGCLGENYQVCLYFYCLIMIHISLHSSHHFDVMPPPIAFNLCTYVSVLWLIVVAGHHVADLWDLLRGPKSSYDSPGNFLRVTIGRIILGRCAFIILKLFSATYFFK